MPGATPEGEAFTAVIPGAFSPGLFSPWWLASKQIIPNAEAETSRDVLISDDYSRFDTEWFSLEVITERLMVNTTKAPYFGPLRDLVYSILNILPETPVRAVGLNRSSHFALHSEELWHSLGHRLAPKEALWDDVLEQPGTQRLTIRAQREDDRLGMINVTVEPSVKVVNGFYVDINDHFARPLEIDDTAGAEWAIEILESGFREHEARIKRITDRIVSFAETGGD